MRPFDRVLSKDLHQPQRRHWQAWLTLGILLVGPVVYADSYIQVFRTAHALSDGTVVQIAPNDPGSIEAVSGSSATDAYGVVVDANNPPSTSQADVASAGHFDVLVSDQNGPISTGDYLIVSSSDGVAMKDDGSQPVAIGQALNSFPGQGVSTTQQVTLPNGARQTVHVGLVEANVNVGPNPLENQVQRYVPPFLRRVAGVISNGKLLSPWRIYLATLVAILTFAAYCVITYVGVRSAVIAVGRQPLAKTSIFQAMFTTLGIAFALLVVGCLTVFLMLRL